MLPEAERKAALEGLTEEQFQELLYDWLFWARPEQRPPAADLILPSGKEWTTWLILAGRGFGKTRSGAEWVRHMVETKQSGRLAIVGDTAADARDVMVEGESGILAISPPWAKPVYEPSKRRVTWPNGAVASLFSAEDPDALRGPQFDAAWCDEIAKWKYARDTWDNLQFGLRLGDRPRQCVTTTPRPLPILKEIIARADTLVTRGSTYDNRANLAPTFFKEIIRRYEGSRLGRQELQAEIIDEVPGALWTRAGIEANRRNHADDLPDMQRIVVAIDPATAEPETDNDGNAETGIVAAGLGVDGRGYVLRDLSCRLLPDGWARRAVSGIDELEGDAIVAETNQGGAMVKSTIRTVRPTVKVIEVHASRGKITRAEPISALYEQGRISHVGMFPELEDQMMLFTPYGMEGNTTGDRVDALVWALTELFPQMTKKRPRTSLQVQGVSGFNPHKF